MDAPNHLAVLLRERGHRSTPPRRLVWDALTSARGHLTAEQIAAEVHRRDPSVNLSSVYRTLALFTELDLVRESNLGTNGGSRWEPAHPDDQFHLVCESCGEVQHHAGDLVDEIRTHLAADHGFAADRVELVVTGICSSCAAGT
ncbi:MAG: Fur family transcriptional regulator [Acidimicrobiia bacterium]